MWNDAIIKARNDEPPELRRDELPEWAHGALVSLEEACANGEGHHIDGRRWHLPEHGLALWWWRRPFTPWMLCPALLPIGLAVLFWAELAIVEGAGFAAWRWVAGGTLTVVGALGVSRMSRWLQPNELNGLLFAPQGLVVIDRGRYRVAARVDIDDLVLVDGCVIAISGTDRRRLRSCASTTPKSLEACSLALRQWKRSGFLPTSTAGRKRRKPIGVWAVIIGSGLLVAGSAALALHLTTSDATRVVRSFVSAIAADDYAAAYELLSNEKKRQLPREDFAASLPSKIRDATGFTVTAMGYGGETCVEGSLQGVRGPSGIVFKVVADGDVERIADWGDGHCR